MAKLRFGTPACYAGIHQKVIGEGYAIQGVTAIISLGDDDWRAL